MQFLWRIEEKLSDSLTRVWQLFVAKAISSGSFNYCSILLSIICHFLSLSLPVSQCEHGFAFKTTYAAKWLPDIKEEFLVRIKWSLFVTFDCQSKLNQTNTKRRTWTITSSRNLDVIQLKRTQNCISLIKSREPFFPVCLWRKYGKQ